MELPIAATQSVQVYLKDHLGDVLDIALDPPGVWQRASPSVPVDSLALLATVDPYGDTIFNYQRCADLANEIRKLRQNATGADAEFFDKVEALATEVVSHHNLRLVFVGD